MDHVALKSFGDTKHTLMDRMIQSVDPDINHHAAAAELKNSGRHSQFTPEHISRIFHAGISMVKDILLTTTQQGIWHAVLPLNQCYSINHLNLHNHYLAGEWTMDHIESKYKPIRQPTGAFVFSNGNLVAVYPTNSKNDDDATESL